MGERGDDRPSNLKNGDTMVDDDEYECVGMTMYAGFYILVLVAKAVQVLI